MKGYSLVANSLQIYRQRDVLYGAVRGLVALSLVWLLQMICYYMGIVGLVSSIGKGVTAIAAELATSYWNVSSTTKCIILLLITWCYGMYLQQATYIR